MRALRLNADWNPKPGYVLSERERANQRALVSSQVYHRPRLSLEDVSAPSPGPGEVLIRIKACGVCGSDIHLHHAGPDGYVAYADQARLPVVLGHEWSGVVEEAGSGVTWPRRGDSVAVEPNNWCGTCTPCRAGMVNQCANLEEIGFTIDGGFADYVITRPKYCWSIDALAQAFGDQERVYDAGALVEPCGVAYNAMFIRAGGFHPGGNVAVFGAGPIGLVAIALARVAGAAAVIAFETVEERRNLAAQLGADHVLDPIGLARDGQDPIDIVMHITHGAGVAMGVEAAGASSRTFPILEGIIAVGGKIVQVGIGPGQTPVSLVRLQQQGVSVYGSMGNSGYGIFPNVIRLMAAKRLDLRAMITGRFPLDQGLQAFAETEKRQGGKVLVRP
jgi:threonine dehydrogenase-like Zn-dependent dehydrogenase